MTKRGPKPKSIIDTTWRPNLAYAIGLIATDGSLGQDGLLVDITSKDREQLENFSQCLGVNFFIGKKFSGKGDMSLRIQFKNRIFYDFLVSIGLTRKKSLTIDKINIPKKYFFDFLRGCFDGDGTVYNYFDSRFKSSLVFYTSFASGSKKFLDWIQDEVYKNIKVKSHITNFKGGLNNMYQLKYSKYASLKLFKKMYYDNNVICLSRKKLKIERILDIVGKTI